MPLTELQCRQTKALPKTYVLSDGHGLNLEVRPSGKKYWIVRMWEGGKEKRRSLGTFPAITLKEAREKNLALRTAGEAPKGDLFGDIAQEWIERKVEGVMSPAYVIRVKLRMAKHILPSLAKIPIREIASAQILAVCREIEDAGTTYTAHRIQQLIGQVFRYAIAIGKAENDPTLALHGALSQAQTHHHAAIIDREGIRSLIRSIDAYGGVLVRMAMLFSLYTFCRPGEIRHAEWCEIEDDTWKIPGEKMKMKRPHIVPLASQAIDLLRELRTLTGYQKWLFPSARNDERPMSENAVRVALRSMGYTNEQMTAHGFRGMASTILHENGWNSDIIERQLAHVDRSAVRAAYNHAEYLPQRREMMQWWADWLESVRSFQ